MRRVLVTALLVALGAGATAYAGPSVLLSPSEQLSAARSHLQKQVRPNVRSEGIPTTRTGPATCTAGKAAGFACAGVDLLSYVPLEEFKGDGQAGRRQPDRATSEASDLWGWTDPDTGSEYVMHRQDQRRGLLRHHRPGQPGATSASLENTSAVQLLWFDIKVYAQPRLHRQRVDRLRHAGRGPHPSA